MTWLVWAALRRVDRCSFRDTPARWLSVSLPNEIGEPAGTPANPQVAAVQWLTVVVVVPLLALYVFSTLTGG